MCESGQINNSIVEKGQEDMVGRIWLLFKIKVSGIFKLNQSKNPEYWAQYRFQIPSIDNCSACELRPSVKN
jgi:hypothetical protein